MMSARLRKTELASQWLRQIMPDALDRIELWAVGLGNANKVMLSGIASAWLSCHSRHPTGLRRGRREDQQGVGRGADLGC